MKNLFTPGMYILLLLIAKNGFSQDEKPHLSVENVLKLNFLLPGISYEHKIGNYTTLNVAAYMDGIISDKIESPNRQSHLFLTPSFNAEFRYYYNLKTRDIKGKPTALNCANYIAPVYIGRYSHTSYFSDYQLVNQVGAVWGMQRNYPKGFSLDVNGGLAYTFKARNNYYYDPIELLLQANIGFWMGRKGR
ncbi:MAG TPA: hypothetical protein VFG10_14135 [Saprospiraceae bacterium]|nr:hypothetical protein [Saprospiraceae bacterium]